MAKKQDFKVDFIGIGLQRCGTTWLSKCLAEHPEVCFSEPKEPHYFDILIDQGKSLEDYREFFANCNGEEKAVGEYTTSYFSEKKSLEKIKEIFPEVKIIVSLRNPLDRAFSQYLYRKRKSGAHKDFKSVIENNEANIVSTGYYHEQLQKIYSVFEKDKVLVLIHDDYKIDALKYIQQAYRFIGVNDSYRPEALYVGTNRTKNLRYRLPWLRWALSGKRFELKKHKVWSKFIPVMKIFGLHKVVQTIDRVNTISGEHAEDESMTEEEKNMLKDIYASDVEELGKLLNRDLKFWLKA